MPPCASNLACEAMAHRTPPRAMVTSQTWSRGLNGCLLVLDKAENFRFLNNQPDWGAGPPAHGPDLAPSAASSWLFLLSGYETFSRGWNSNSRGNHGWAIHCIYCMHPDNLDASTSPELHLWRVNGIIITNIGSTFKVFSTAVWT